ncbi:HNH endonuclease signature motif containing protein [Kribbella pratensis]|uniref:HNH endonuclease n=1 Tax=Kribbella pratensis TaxID=2512112 RepID=A0A4V3GI02_9ACTN|nr:HNH endonuclease signature motif containing protein [Kribbella pratensis]TDW77587.1 HNH endonuclease [Kribbella pratensis]
MHPAQAAAIVAILDKLPPSVPAENLEFAERQLIDLAATHTPSDLRKAGHKIRDILDPDGPEPDEKAAYARESLTWKTADRGVTFRGFLANENAELFRTLIHAHAKPHRTVDGQLDPRPLSKRQADAVTTILNTTSTAGTTGTAGLTSTVTSTAAAHTRPADSGTANDCATDDDSDGEGGTLIRLPLPPADTGRPDARARDAEGRDADRRDADGSGGDPQLVPGHGAKPHISITIDYNDLAAATANATGALIFGDNLSAATVRQLACDAEILPIVLGSKSQPLDVGTSQRLVTRPMRRALNARDKGCVVCGAPPIHCDAHHVVSWLDGGITAVSNLALLCKRDHRDLHSGHWRIRILEGVVQVTHPTWANPTAIPPGKYKPPTADIVHQPTTPRPDPWSDDDHPSGPNNTPPPTPARPTEPAPFDPWGGQAADVG